MLRCPKCKIQTGSFETTGTCLIQVDSKKQVTSVQIDTSKPQTLNSYVCDPIHIILTCQYCGYQGHIKYFQIDENEDGNTSIKQNTISKKQCSRASTKKIKYVEA